MIQDARAVKLPWCCAICGYELDAIVENPLKT